MLLCIYLPQPGIQNDGMRIVVQGTETNAALIKDTPHMYDLKSNSGPEGGRQRFKDTS